MAKTSSMVCVLLSHLVVRDVSQPHRRNRVRDHRGWSALAQHCHRVGSGSSQDVGGAGWTDATASSRNMFGARMNKSVKEQTGFCRRTDAHLN